MGSIIFLTEGILDITVHELRKLKLKGLKENSTIFTKIVFGDQSSATNEVESLSDTRYNHGILLTVDKSSSPYVTFQTFAKHNQIDSLLGTIKLNIQDIFVKQPIIDQWMPLENSESGEIKLSLRFIEAAEAVSSGDEKLSGEMNLLEQENESLLYEVPEELLTNLSKEIGQMLKSKAAIARKNILKGELGKSSYTDSRAMPSEKKNKTEIEDILNLVKDLDEESSKFIYEQLQTILSEIDQEQKQKQILQLKEELIELQMEQTKIMPQLPPELIASSPEHLKDNIQNSVKDAFLQMASEKDDKNNKTENKIRQPEKEIDSKTDSDFEVMGSDFLMKSIPDELLANLLPEAANTLKPIESNIKILSKYNEENNSNQEDSDDDNDDVTLPPTPAVQTPWSVVANQPARPSGPTPDSEVFDEKMNPFDKSFKKESTIIVTNDKKTSSKGV